MTAAHAGTAEYGWNVVASVREGAYRRARAILSEFGPTCKTAFYNVLLLRVESLPDFMETLAVQASTDPTLRDVFGRIVPVTTSFTFQSPQAFEDRAREIVGAWAPLVAGRTFYVRMHRRGFKGRISSQEEERLLDHLLIERTAASGARAEVNFDDPDAVIDVETVGQWAGLSYWDRAARARFPFLNID